MPLRAKYYGKKFAIAARVPYIARSRSLPLLAGASEQVGTIRDEQQAYK
jgi:hypothetical protein